MKKATNEAISISRYISSFLHEYAPIHITGSDNTLNPMKLLLRFTLSFLRIQKMSL